MELVPFTERHLGDIADLIADPEVLRFTRIPEPPPDGFPRQWLDRYERGRADGTAEAFAIEEDGRFLGLALAPSIERQESEVELGYIVTRAARGRGVGAQALAALTRWALEELGAQRVVLIIDVLNEPSKRIAVRCGYVREGVMRSIHLKQDRRVDAELWSRLPGDPAPSPPAPPRTSPAARPACPGCASTNRRSP
jgi:RimJ/RimL family protein N-acetyltransferase